MGIKVSSSYWLRRYGLTIVIGLSAGCDGDPPTSATSVARGDPVQHQNQPQAQISTHNQVPQAAAPVTPATVLVLGDSISAGYGMRLEQGWVHLLQQKLRAFDETLTVVNASISGETTGGGLRRLDASLATHAPKIVVVELGGNDALRGYPIQQIDTNLRSIVSRSQDAGAHVLLVGMQIPPNYGQRYSQGFSGLFPAIASETNSGLVESLLEPLALQPELMQSDGIHPTAAAQPMLLSAIWPGIEKLLED